MMSWIYFFAFFVYLSTSFVVNGQISQTQTMHDILLRLDALEHQLVELKTENIGLRRSNVALVKDIERLKEQDSQLMDRIKLLEGSEHILASESVGELNGEIYPAEQDRIVSNGQPKVHFGHYDGKEKGNNFAKKRIQSESFHKRDLNRIRQLEQGSSVAFLATRSSSHAEHLGQHQPVVFERTITNVGQAYHNSTGIFIAPVSGVYVFSVTILTTNEAAHFQIAINGQPYTIMYAHGTETFETLSQTVVFILSKGDDVAIQSYDSDKLVYGSDYSTFSGFLLVPTEGNVVIG